MNGRDGVVEMEEGELRETGEVRETGEEISEAGGGGDAPGDVCEKSGGGSTGVGEKTAGVCEASDWKLVVLKRCSKCKNILQVEGGGKAGRLEDGEAAGDSSNNESYMSDSSELSLSQTNTVTASQGEKLYTGQMIKSFLQKTKGVKNLNLDHHFSDKLIFFLSAKHIIKHRASSGLTEQEIYRLKKQMIKVRKQINL